MPLSLTCFRTVSFSSCKDIAKITKGSSLKYWCRFSREGNSFLHHGHHVAQKLSRTTFPLNAFRETCSPSKEGRMKSGEVTGSVMCCISIEPIRDVISGSVFVTTGTPVFSCGTLLSQALTPASRIRREISISNFFWAFTMIDSIHFYYIRAGKLTHLSSY